MKEEKQAWMLLGVISTIVLALLISTMVSKKKPSVDVTKRAIYHWKSVYAPSKWELNFLKTHQIERIYMKFFDVVVNEHGKSEAYPIATTVFNKAMPKGMEVVPTVYITYEALRSMKGEESSYAEKIVKRSLNMIDANNLGEIREFQLDCDWTVKTQESYFLLCKEVRQLLAMRNVSLSATIRLHQLGDECPPVDRGVLMLYNTGALKDFNTKNSIIDYNDIKAYLKKIEGYSLPLDFAYPTFEWDVAYSDTHFQGIIRGAQVEDERRYKPISENRYEVISGHRIDEQWLWEGYVLRHETSPINVVLRTKQKAEQLLGGSNYATIIYHLDSANLSKYSSHEIEEILTTR